MSDELLSNERAMIDCEAVTAGVIRQSSEGGDRCPECNSPRAKTYVDGAVAYGCGSVYRANGDPEHMGDKCPYLRAEWLEERERAALAHNARLRRVVEQVEWVEPPDAHPGLGRWCPACRAWESDGHEVHCPYYGGQVNGILADAPANPYLAAIAALRELVTLHDDVRYRDPADYERRKPLAWEAAREALRGVGAVAALAALDREEGAS